MCEIKVSVIGLGFVGNAMFESFLLKGMSVGENLFGYDKYKNGGIGSFDQCLMSDIIFLALPTPFSNTSKQYDKSAIDEVCVKLQDKNYKGIVVIKSTVEPETTNKLSYKYTDLQFVHNPEFLSAQTAFHDFHTQSHIVLGKGPTCNQKNMEKLIRFYEKYYSDNKNFAISQCNSTESESMKIFVNCFYSIKIQTFTEFYLLCQKNGSNFDEIKKMMIMNGWINPMHTQIPGPDGQISYGGYCFPKDTLALCEYMVNKESPNLVINATIQERNSMRKDQLNCE